jgi:predicted nucleotidyltransferase component of viral defense system
MTGHEPPSIRVHEDVVLLREAVNFTAAQTAFAARLIEKDYYCTVLLAYLSETAGKAAVFKGGTCLAKVIGDFYRLSEDLDFAISVPVDAGRERRRRHVAGMKIAIANVAERLSTFALDQPLRGANNSTQYIGAVSYRSPLSGQPEAIKVEISLREPLLMPVLDGSARTILLDPVNGKPLVPPLAVRCISRQEAWAEKFRAALTRREVAIRDFYDLDYAVGKLGLRHGDAEMVTLVRQKLAVPGNDPVDFGQNRLAQLRAQIETRLRPVLRQRDYEAFDLARAFNVVAEMARLVG